MPASFIHLPSSYRDPSGYVFEKNGIIYRQVNKIFSEDFDFFISGGCYDALVKKNMLIPHETIHENLTGDENWHVTLKPQRVGFITYPFEWSFNMLRDAALLTLQLLKEGIEWGMILKDATPYNIQWHEGKLVLIDSLSFEKYDESTPWIAYRQFCENFLSPLLLAHYSKHPVQELLLAYPEGIPLGLTSKFLPRRTKFNLHVYLNIHLHAKYSAREPKGENKKIQFSKKKLLNLVSSLETSINKLNLPDITSTWSAYYDEASQRSGYYEEKIKVVVKWLGQVNPLDSVADLGANTGEFSKLADTKTSVLAADFDPWCINKLYREIKTGGITNILPIILDLSRPSPSFGVNNIERDSFINRVKVDLCLALALVHHLAIGKNIPFTQIAFFFQQVCRHLLVEFIPKSDEKVKLMLKDKKDIYPDYNEENFLLAFQKYFTVTSKQEVGQSGRILYLMQKNER